MTQDYTQVNFRIPKELKELIEQESIANNRSITAELVSRLEKSFELEQQANLKTMQSTIDIMNSANERLEKAIDLIERQSRIIDELKNNKP